MTEDAIVAAICARLTAELGPPAEQLRPLWVDGHIAGWLDEARAGRLLRHDDAFIAQPGGIGLHPMLATAAQRTAALDRVARALAAEGALSAWRSERYAISPGPGEAPLFELERAAARYFGVATHAAHVNGVVRRDDGIAMWFARRSAVKAIDPGMLDNLVGGGVAAGATVAGTVEKEAFEEAGIPAGLARCARASGEVRICRLQADGLQRETIHVHDLWLPADFLPRSQDGEVSEHRLVSLDEAARLVAQGDGPDAVTADASLVIVDFLLRHGAVERDSPHHAALDALRHPTIALGEP